MTAQSQRIKAIAEAILSDARRLPDHREVVASIGLAEFHRLLALEIQALTNRTAWHMTWRRVAPELVEGGVETWALILASKARHMIDEAVLVIGGVWVLDTERSGRVELVATAAAASIAALRERAKDEVLRMLDGARRYLLVVLPEHPSPEARMLAAQLLRQEPLTLEDVVAAGRLLGAPVQVK